jgi:bla regulator protein blaR1
MSSIYNLFPQELVSSIGWTLLHSLWQGGIISVILYITLYFVRNKSANLKALISTAALLLLVISAIVTYNIESNSTAASSSLTGLSETSGLNTGITGFNSDKIVSAQSDILSAAYSKFQFYFKDNIDLIVTIWLAGLFLFAIRLLGGLFYLARIKRKISIVKDSLWNNRIEILCRKINLKVRVSLAETTHTNVPVVIGYFKPVILFPFGLLTGLPQEHIEAILAHEIAHLKRYDLIINLFQSITETIFFYNPLVWWISNKIRIEREYCCDDIAINLCGDELVYAKALVNLESLIESNMPLFAIPLFKNKNQLLRRIKRMLHKNENRNSFKEKFATAIIFIGILITAVVFKNVNAETPSKEVNTINVPIAAVIPALPMAEFESTTIDTIVSNKRGTSTFTFEKEVNGDTKEFRVRVKDGKITSLFIDDEKATKEEIVKYQPMIIEMIKKHEAEMAKHEENMKKHELDMQKHEQDMRKYDEDMKKHAEAMEKHDFDMKQHEKDMKKHEEEMKKHEIEMKKHEAFIKDLKQMLADEGKIKKISSELNMKFNNRRIIVNGVKLSDEILKKALQLYKKHYNKEMSDESSTNINNGGSNVFDSDDE